jgi:hypothetical protein
MNRDPCKLREAEDGKLNYLHIAHGGNIHLLTNIDRIADTRGIQTSAFCFALVLAPA